MAYFYIHVYPDAKQVALGDELFEERLTIGATSLQSPAYSSGNSNLYVRIAAGDNCQYKKGDEPTAGPLSVPLFAGQVEHIWIKPGQKIAVIELQP